MQNTVISPTNLTVDDAVVLDGSDAILRYRGETVHPGVWYGFELSTQTGDCDGTLDGHSYFECRQNHGKFIQENDMKNHNLRMRETNNAGVSPNPQNPVPVPAHLPQPGFVTRHLNDLIKGMVSVLFLVLLIIVIFPHSLNSTKNTMLEPIGTFYNEIRGVVAITTCHFFPDSGLCTKTDAVSLVHELTIHMHKPLPTTISLETVDKNIHDVRKLLAKQGIQKFNIQEEELTNISARVINLKKTTSMSIFYQKEYMKKIHKNAERVLEKRDVFALNDLTRAAQVDLRRQRGMYYAITEELEDTKKQIENLEVKLLRDMGNSPCSYINWFDHSDQCTVYRTLENSEKILDDVLAVLRRLDTIFVEKMTDLAAAELVGVAAFTEDDIELVEEILALELPSYEEAVPPM